MITPEEIEYRAAQVEEENYAFRTYLKMHADSDKLDQQFLELHKELFSSYDCNSCRRCCKKYHGEIKKSDVGNIAASLEMEPDRFISEYLVENEEDTYKTKNAPCDFLQSDGSCLLGENRPESCKAFPYTDRPDRMGSLLSIVQNATVCPVVFEILERLKKEYHFDKRKSSYSDNQGNPYVRIKKKIFPNDPCPCGSGLKYKICCGKK